MLRFSKKIGIMFLAVFIAVFAFGGSNAYAVLDVEGGWLPEKEEWMPDFDTSTTFVTQYIWRGQNLGTEPVIQFDASLAKYGFTFDLWFNYTANNDKAVESIYQEITELDYTITYDFSVGEMVENLGMEGHELLDPWGITLGYIFYTFPNLDLDLRTSKSHETIIGTSYDVLLQPFFTWYWDVEAGHGSYLQFGGGHTFDFEESGISANLGLAFGYNYEQYTSEHGWSDVLFTADVSIPFFNYFYVTPSVGYSVILDESTYLGVQKNEFYGGIAIGFSY